MKQTKTNSLAMLLPILGVAMAPRRLVFVSLFIASASAAEAAPVMPFVDSAVLPTGEMSVSDRPNDSFTGIGGLGVETTVLVGFTGGVAVRPCATLRLGPVSGCIGIIAAGGTIEFNAAIDIFSYQRSGWEIALGIGLHDGVTVRSAVPLTWAGVPKFVRLRLMSSLGGGGTVRLGGGLEVDLW